MSDTVLDALARALRMDDTERAHLHDLARAAGTSPRRRRKPADPQGVRPNVQRLLDAMTDTPALVINGRTDVLASNALGRALFAPLHDTTTRPPNHARFIFLDARSHDFWDNWEHAADDAVALLHTQAGRNPFDTDLTALIGELSTRSEDFRTRWARHDVRRHATGVKHLRHPAVGTLHLTFEAMELVADTGLTLLAYGAEARHRLRRRPAPADHLGGHPRSTADGSYGRRDLSNRPGPVRRPANTSACRCRTVRVPTSRNCRTPRASAPGMAPARAQPNLGTAGPPLPGRPSRHRHAMGIWIRTPNWEPSCPHVWPA